MQITLIITSWADLAAPDKGHCLLSPLLWRNDLSRFTPPHSFIADKTSQSGAGTSLVHVNVIQPDGLFKKNMKIFIYLNWMDLILIK